MNPAETSTETTRAAVADVVKRTLLKEGGASVALEEVGEATRLDGLNIDSLTFIRAVIGMEEAFGRTFGDELVMQGEFKTVGDVVAFVHQALAAEARS